MTHPASHPAAGADGAPVAHFPAGDARGVRQDGLCVYRGVPYAMPPAGPRRWRPPLPMSRWQG
ncbi:MAG: carboxylesterase family protein, partial [Aquamicrobium sp.]|nr:carboxylesterase family protein [Aquamicrobium sp.]